MAIDLFVKTAKHLVKGPKAKIMYPKTNTDIDSIPQVIHISYSGFDHGNYHEGLFFLNGIINYGDVPYTIWVDSETQCR